MKVAAGGRRKGHAGWLERGRRRCCNGGWWWSSRMRVGDWGADYQVTPKDVDEKIQRHDGIKWAESKVKFSAEAPTTVTCVALQQSTYWGWNVTERQREDSLEVLVGQSSREGMRQSVSIYQRSSGEKCKQFSWIGFPSKLEPPRGSKNRVSGGGREGRSEGGKGSFGSEWRCGGLHLHCHRQLNRN